MTANDVINKFLIAKQDRPIFAFPGGSQIGVVKKGLVVGPVYSWIKKITNYTGSLTIRSLATLQDHTTQSIGQSSGRYQQLAQEQEHRLQSQLQQV